MDWTASEEKKLRDLWMRQGLSGRQIGDRMGRSRCSVMGKLHRMGLFSPDREKYNSNRKIKTYLKAATKSVTKPARAKENPDEMRAVVTAALGVSDCRYPLWGPEQRSGHHCGNPTNDGSPYCEHHMRVAYVPGTALGKKNWLGKIDMAAKKYD